MPGIYGRMKNVCEDQSEERYYERQKKYVMTQIITVMIFETNGAKQIFYCSVGIEEIDRRN